MKTLNIYRQEKKNDGIALKALEKFMYSTGMYFSTPAGWSGLPHPFVVATCTTNFRLSPVMMRC